MKISMGDVHPRASMRRMGWFDRGLRSYFTINSQSSLIYYLHDMDLHEEWQKTELKVYLLRKVRL